MPLDAGTFSEEWAWASGLARRSFSLAELSAGDSHAWFVLGGHGALCDLVRDTATQNILAAALVSERPVAAVDHGCAVLGTLRAADGTSLLAGRAVTGRSDAEERQVRHHTLVPSTTEHLLRRAGGRYRSRSPWEEFVVVDRNLVTGQNPASTAVVVTAVIGGMATAVQAA